MVASSCAAPVPGFMRTSSRPKFSPSVPVDVSESPAPPITAENDSTAASFSSAACAASSARSVTASGVPSGSSTS
jgi:hypothetical protein